MDPNEALRQMRESASEIERDLGEAFDEGSQVGSLITHFDALDNWLKTGGFLPAEWERNHPIGRIVQSPRMHGIFGAIENVRPQSRTGQGWGSYEFLVRSGETTEWIDENQVETATYEDVRAHFGALLKASTREAAELRVLLREVRNDPLYEKCRDCHLFVEPNSGHVEGDNIAPYMHLARGNPADEKLDGDHEPVPSGMKANLATWKVLGPVAMRERFVTPEQWSNY